MSTSNVVVFSLLAIAVAFFATGKTRNWSILVVSVLGIYWLQPLMPIRYMDFWLPTLTLSLTIISWVAATPLAKRNWGHNWKAIIVVVGVVISVGLTRYINQAGIFTATRPPDILEVALFICFFAIIALAFSQGLKIRLVLAGMVSLILLLLVVLKFTPLTLFASSSLRELMGQSTEIDPSVSYLRWLGFSYVAFRLIHTLRDAQLGRPVIVTLQEYIIYILFFPAYSAGPIDRMDRFIKDLRTPIELNSDQTWNAGYRLISGLFKKFVLADSLALIALNSVNTNHTNVSIWLWVMLYAYTLQIYFDFSGYSDIAIGLGQFMGIKLPENFNHPYLKPNLTQFWNNWHMTLTNWIRAYYFTPLSRYMIKYCKQIPSSLMMLFLQITTMVIIGLWHGITLNFVFWGLWHGVGLYVQNRWSDWSRRRLPGLNTHNAFRVVIRSVGTILTIQYVALGWIWFALPTPEASWQVLIKLFSAN